MDHSCQMELPKLRSGFLISISIEIELNLEQEV